MVAWVIAESSSLRNFLSFASEAAKPLASDTLVLSNMPDSLGWVCVSLPGEWHSNRHRGRLFGAEDAAVLVQVRVRVRIEPRERAGQPPLVQDLVIRLPL